MDAVDFIKNKHRMCKYYRSCLGCPLSEYVNKTTISCGGFIKDNPEIAVNVIENWSKEHPSKTMLQDFLEKYPKAILDTNKTPLNICPPDLGYTNHKLCAGGICDSKTCEECWNRPLEE